jgi:hypothetical protein
MVLIDAEIMSDSIARIHEHRTQITILSPGVAIHLRPCVPIFEVDETRLQNKTQNCNKQYRFTTSARRAHDLRF